MCSRIVLLVENSAEIANGHCCILLIAHTYTRLVKEEQYLLCSRNSLSTSAVYWNQMKA